MTKRALCPSCNRPQSTCLCPYLVQLESPILLTILQDKKEAKHALSSAPLLQKSILNTRLIIGDTFSPETLFGSDWQTNTALLFPSESAISASPENSVTFKHIIVLDGTWKKVARLMHLNPWLNSLQHFSIKADQDSQYRIRKSPRTDGLSTIEATVSLFNQMTDSTKFDAVLPAFEQMIQFQIDAMGMDKFSRNYKEKR